MKLQIIWPNVIITVIFALALIFLLGCGDPPLAPVAKVTVHVYTKDGSAVWCPEELNPAPTTWEYNGTAEVDADHEDVLSQCELE